MKKLTIFLSVLVVFLFSAISSAAYDGTGIWNYTEHSLWNNCGEPNIPESGEVGILQSGSTFLVVDDDFSTYGNVSGSNYSYSDTFCEEGGVVSVSVNFFLTSENSAQGTVSWTWSGVGESCSGGFQITLSKQTQVAHLYDATGKWNFNQSGFSHDCGSATTPRGSGYFEVTQTENKITAIDDKGNQYSGFVNGAEYSVVRSWWLNGGRNTEWFIINLSSGGTQGNGTGEFVWDDNCDDCGGSWSISVTKEVSTPTKNAMPWIPLLLLDESIDRDTTAPTVPTGLSATAVSSNQINLSWTASTDNVGVAGYKIYSGYGTYIKSVTGTSTSLTGLNPGAQYCYKVSAYDAVNNESAQCAEKCDTTPPGTQTITLNPQYDNAVLINSYDPNVANSVYTNHTLPVGCNWTFNEYYYPEYWYKQDYLCGQGLVKFNLSAIAGKTIDSATLRLRASSIGVGYVPRQWHVRAQATSWSPSTVTWNIVDNSQYYIGSEIILYPPGYYGQSDIFEIDVTSIVQKWASGTFNNYGLLFGSHDYTFPLRTSFDAFELYSLEDPGKEGPKLIVNYH